VALGRLVGSHLNNIAHQSEKAVHRRFDLAFSTLAKNVSSTCQNPFCKRGNKVPLILAKVVKTWRSMQKNFEKGHETLTKLDGKQRMCK
jgi:hypothetical protein